MEKQQILEALLKSYNACHDHINNSGEPHVYAYAFGYLNECVSRILCENKMFPHQKEKVGNDT
jgi:hypothetical protein